MSKHTTVDIKPYLAYKSIDYFRFVQELYNRGYTIREWCEKNQISRFSLWVFFNPKPRKHPFRGGPSHIRIAKLIMGQSLPMPDGDSKNE